MPGSRLFIISSVAGGGKSTLINLLLEKHSDAFFSVSCTTRAPRPGDIPGKTYHFLTVPDFKEKIQNSEFFEYAEVHGNFYGTPKEPILRALHENRVVLLDIDVQGAASVKKLRPDSMSIFIQPPSLEVWKSRLRNRGTDSPETVERRIRNGMKELSKAPEFDHLILNNELDVALAELESIVFPKTTK